MPAYGLIGYPLSHTFSPNYFAEKFAKEGLKDCSYKAFPIGDINDLPGLINSEKLAGLNVTIPYKKAVLPFLDRCDPVVAAIQSCNCIRVENGQLSGFNTDVIGFELSLKPLLQQHHKNALILGTGGSSAAVAYVLQKLGLEYLFVSRKPGSSKEIGYTDLSAKLIAAHPLIINTTPVGMFPANETFPQIPYQFLTGDHYLFDLVYNPAKTIFLQKGEEQGATIKNGGDMLAIQAEQSWKIWTA